MNRDGKDEDFEPYVMSRGDKMLAALLVLTLVTGLIVVIPGLIAITRHRATDSNGGASVARTRRASFSTESGCIYVESSKEAAEVSVCGVRDMIIVTKGK